MPQMLNDVHSQLNATTVAELACPQTLANLQGIIRRARAAGLPVSVAGGRHAMGGQQFAAGSLHIDMTGLDRVLHVDPVRGLLHIEAGADWPKMIAASHTMEISPGITWGIRQKQTGVDAVSRGGAVPATPVRQPCRSLAGRKRGPSIDPQAVALGGTAYAAGHHGALLAPQTLD